ncbi:hypothetical protein C8A03DRAFT_18978, partial [Achaetomium macrosporum]
QELLETIRHQSQQSLLWRCILVFQVAAHISATAPEPLLTLSLCDLHSWERNGMLQRVTISQSSLPILRLTVDSRSISKVERLLNRPQYTGECTSRSAFIVVQDDSALGVEAQLKDGCLRLVFPGRPSFQLWNTPTPPSLALCRAYPADIARCQSFYAVEMDKINGLTLFFSGARLFGLHVHHLGESCAIDDYIRALSNRRRRSIVWIYLPISKGDRPALLGIREGLQTRTQSTVIRTKLVGDVVLGMQCKGAIRDSILGASPPLTMIYGEPKQGDPVCFFGIYCRAQADQGLTKPFRLPNPYGSRLGDEAYFSWAPLSGVSSTLVFYDEINGDCRGILLRYRNGGARAVGQCRLQVDPVEGVAEPVQLCFRVDSCSSSFNRILYIARVKFKQTAQASGTAEDERWESHEMEGMIKFWFTPESCFVAIDN